MKLRQNHSKLYNLIHEKDFYLIFLCVCLRQTGYTNFYTIHNHTVMNYQWYAHLKFAKFHETKSYCLVHN